jgi:hypothetical protein
MPSVDGGLVMRFREGSFANTASAKGCRQICAIGSPFDSSD